MKIWKKTVMKLSRKTLYFVCQIFCNIEFSVILKVSPRTDDTEEGMHTFNSQSSVYIYSIISSDGDELGLAADFDTVSITIILKLNIHRNHHSYWNGNIWTECIYNICESFVIPKNPVEICVLVMLSISDPNAHHQEINGSRGDRMLMFADYVNQV